WGGTQGREPVSTAAAQRLVAAPAWVDGQAITVDLRSARVVTVVGPQDMTRAVARALVCQAAAFHSPEDVRVAVAVSAERAAAWDWCKWLPHLKPGSPGDVQPPPTVVHEVAGLEALICTELDAVRRVSESRGFAL